MPFDPSKPVNNAPVLAAELRSQFIALNTDIVQRATFADLAATLASTSNNSNGVATMSQSADGNYNQIQMQQVMDKLDELINALRR